MGVAVSVMLTGCVGADSVDAAGAGPPAGRTSDSGLDGTVTLPPIGAEFDYQLGGPYPPPSEVSIVERDRTTSPDTGYGICYVNGFQTQPAESDWFAENHPDLLVQDKGKLLVDPDWPDEYIFDVSTADKRTAVVDIVRPWIQSCKSAGFAAVEIDNLDSYSRSQGALTVEDNLALAATYAGIAHEAGLAIAQKNTPDQSERLESLGYDFAIAESCYHFDECQAYSSVYPVVLDIEYMDELGEHRFSDACSDEERPSSMILRDHDLVTPGDVGYAYQSCG
jgi:hypothetical protein